MKESRSYANAEYIYGARLSGEILSQFMFTNMPPEAEKAIDLRIVTPTVTEFIRLSGIAIEDQPPLTIEELIGPTRLGDVESRFQALYFTGPNHPILQKARASQRFVTYRNLLDVHGDLGIQQQNVTKNFKGLVTSLFEDEAIPTFGKPYLDQLERADQGGEPLLHRFAIRRKMAQLAMNGEYQVGISGTQGTHVFNGYGRALIKALYDPHEKQQRAELLAVLESMPKVAVDFEDPNSFGWNKVYTNREGIGYRMDTAGYSSALRSYFRSLLVEIGAVKQKDYWSDLTISEEGFVLAVKALCPVGTAHVQTIKSGNVCTGGVHYKNLNSKVVGRAKSIAQCISERDAKEITIDIQPYEEELNLEDSGFQQTRTSRKHPDFDW